jgi:hypothetical protein
MLSIVLFVLVVFVAIRIASRLLKGTQRIARWLLGIKD